MGRLCLRVEEHTQKICRTVAEEGPIHKVSNRGANRKVMFSRFQEAQVPSLETFRQRVAHKYRLMRVSLRQGI